MIICHEFWIKIYPLTIILELSEESSRQACKLAINAIIAATLSLQIQSLELDKAGQI